MDDWTRTNIEGQARRWCDHFCIDDYDKYQAVCASMAQQEYMRAIQPFIKMKVDLLRFEMPVYIKHADGRFEAQPPKRTEHVEQTLKMIDEMIANEAARYGLPLPPTSATIPSSS